MREHPAARQMESINRLVGIHVESIGLLDHPESDHVFIKKEDIDTDGKLGELPEFLVYVNKAKKYDLL